MPISTIGQNGLNAPLSLTTPNLGTPSAINLSNATALARAALPTGCVLQVVSSKSNTVVSAVNNADLLAVSITPSSASNKIFVIGGFSSVLIVGSNAYLTGYFYRGTNAGTLIFNDYAGFQTTSGSAVLPWFASVLDSPNTTSSQTYTLVAGKGSGGTTSWSTDSSYSLTLMEIAA